MKDENIKNFISDIEDKIDILYDSEENYSDEELMKFIDLVKLDDNAGFYRTFENIISNLINQDENNNFFEFINQRSLNILDYIFFYINKENIKITNTSKKTKDNKENNEINVDINEKAQKAKKNDINKNKSEQNKSKSLNDTKTES